MEESCDASLRIEAAGLTLEVDARIPLRDYYDLASDLLRQACIHRQKTAVVELYISLLRFSSLVLETLPKHQDYMVKHSRQKYDLTQKASSAKKELESLKPTITCHLGELNTAKMKKDEEIKHTVCTVYGNDPNVEQFPPKVDKEEPTISSESSEKLDAGIDGTFSSDHGIMHRAETLKYTRELCEEGGQPLASHLDYSSCENNSQMDFDAKEFSVGDRNAATTDFLVSNVVPTEDGEKLLDLEEKPVDKKYCVRLQFLIADITSLTQEIFGLICSAQQSEKDAKEAAGQAKKFERLYKKEVRQRSGRERATRDLVLKLDNLRYQRDELLHKVQIAQEEKAHMVGRIEELEDKLKTSQYLMDLLLKERDDARQEIKVLHLKLWPLGSETTDNILHFSVLEIEQATFNFDNDLKIGEGKYTCVYKGFIRHTCVAIKRFDEQCFEGKQKFHQELDLLSRVRHPHFVTIIGICPEASCLVYEFLSNGSLEDYLTCKSSSSPLRWSDRIRIAAEVCSALIFLHSCIPIMFHGNLKPSNILLDANFTSKVCDLRSSQFTDLNPAGTSSEFSDKLPAYIDPEYLKTNEMTTSSDIYSFGVVILWLLTGLGASIVVDVVTEALSEGKLQSILDDSGGEWPFIYANQLAYLGLRCCERSGNDRPDLEGEVWRVLDPLTKATSLGSLQQKSVTQADDVPSYFICPILQEVMKEPHMAADGFTYEEEAIKAWFDSGHDTSPMTNLKLPNQKLMPNRALRSVIKEWMERHALIGFV